MNGGGLTYIAGSADFFITGDGGTGPGVKYVQNRLIYNYGTAYWDADGAITFLGNVTFNNYGQFNALNGNTLTGQNDSNVFNNYGNFLRSGNDGTGDTQITGMPFNNIGGQVQLQIGNLLI